MKSKKGKQSKKYMKWSRWYMVVMLALWLLAACKPRIPSQVIQPDDMEDVLYDYYRSLRVRKAIAITENITTGLR